MTQFISVENKEEKETVFTHYYENRNGWMEATIKPSSYKKVVYLGCCTTDGDMFAGYSENGAITILKGTKGSEFN